MVFNDQSCTLVIENRTCFHCNKHFVEAVLKVAGETLNRKYMIQAQGYDFEWLVERVCGLLGITPEELLTGGKQRLAVKARSVVCFLGTRELGMSASWISEKLNIASSTASESVARGREIVEEMELRLLDEKL